ncbi:MAG: Dabb family protein [Gammaproteobacteria bacterium]
MVFCVALFACTTTPEDKAQDIPVIHIVLVWLNDSDNEEHLQQVIDTSNQLKEIPVVQELRVGKSISSDRKIVDDSFDVGIYMKFHSASDMEDYLVHEKHKQAVKTVLKPLANKILVYDISLPIN